jgi:hypothetical protein
MAGYLDELEALVDYPNGSAWLDDLDHHFRPRCRDRLDQVCGFAALIVHWAAKARSYAGRASPRAT